MPFKLNVLDQSPIPAGSTAGDALRNSLELARLADRLGYYRSPSIMARRASRAIAQR
jgi:hypothetical protein